MGWSGTNLYKIPVNQDQQSSIFYFSKLSHKQFRFLFFLVKIIFLVIIEKKNYYISCRSKFWIFLNHKMLTFQYNLFKKTFKKEKFYAD